jgi:uncharacterized protein (TIGR03437 family)
MRRILFALLFLACSVANAQSITIQNPSFETATLPFPGGGAGPYCNLIASTNEATSGTLANWTGASSGVDAAAGAWAPVVGNVNDWTSKWWVGNNIGFVQAYASATVTLSQALTAMLQNNTTYTLSALIGHRASNPRFNYSLQLLAGSTVLASANSLSLASNSFGTDSVTYSAGPNNALAGMPLTVVISTTGINGATTEVDFDNITLTASAPAPVISANGVVTASAFGDFSSVAAGSWIEIYGSNLAGTTRPWAGSDFNGVNAPTTLSGTMVTIGGVNAFIDYISPTQVNAQVPSNILPGTQQMTVITGEGTSANYTITVSSIEPGLLAPSSFIIGGKQYLVALFTDGFTYVLPPGTIAGVPSQRAKPGDTIVLYGVGFGSVMPSIPAGQIVQQSNILATPVQFSFGGVPATASYAGLAPSFVGLYQFNVTVPNVAANDLVPVTFTLGGVSGTQTLYLAVGN